MKRRDFLKTTGMLACCSLAGRLAAAAPRAKSDRPNILLAIADDWSYGHAGAYGCDWVKTPNFDKLAKEGILFTNAFTPNAKCAPSRATILTGRYSWQLEQAGNHMCIFPAKFGGYVERLAADGYSTGYTGKGWGPGIAKNAAGKRREITGKGYQKRRLKPHARGISPTDYAANFGDFLKESPAGKPWVFWYGTKEPHRGYEFKSGVRLGKKLSDIDRVPGYWPDNETSRHDMLDYAIEVEHYDTHLGRIVKMLKDAGQLDNTLIVATSDHGMPFPRVKGQAYGHSNHIPMAVRWPGGVKSPGRTVKDFVDFTALAPTFLQAAGVKDPAPIMQPISGTSLFDLFAGSKSGAVRDHVLIGKERHDIGRPDDVGYPIRGIRNAEWLYIRNFEPARWPAGNPETGYLNCDGSPIKTDILDLRRSGKDAKPWDLCFGKRPAEELYNLKNDPDCVKNLAEAFKCSDVKKKLKAQMESELKAQGDPRMFGKGDVFDKYPYSGGSTRDFYNRYKNGKRPGAGWVNKSDFEKGPLEK
jgi:N-sulfoglucosamine sulfohydrolase